MLLAPLLFLAFLHLSQSTNLPQVYPRPLYPRPSSPVRGQVGLLGPARIPQRLPPLNRVVWVKKIDPRTGAWVKVISDKRNAINPAARHHFAKKAHIARKMRLMDTIVRARNLARMNTVRGGLLGVTRDRDDDERFHVSAGIMGYQRQRGYHKYAANSRFNRARTGSVGLLGQSVAPRLLNDRAQLLRRNVNLRRRFENDDDFYDDFIDNTLDNRFDDFDNFREIDDSFDDRFDRGFRDTYPLLNTQTNFVRAGVRGFQRFVPQSPRQTSNGILRNPSARAGILGHPRKSYYSGEKRTPRQDINTIGIGGTQIGTIKPLDKLRNTITSAILGTFDSKRKTPFRGMRGTGTAGVLGNQQTANAAIPRMINKAIAINNRLSDSAIVNTPNPTGNIGLPTNGVIGLASVERFPNGLLRDDIDNVDFDDNRLDLVNYELHHLNDRLDLNDHLNMKERISLNEKIHDLNDRLESRLPSVDLGRDDINDDILDRPHIVTAIGGRDNVDDRGDIGLLGQDRSPIDGLELLGPSTWSDIITELQNAALPGRIFDQIPQESVPVFPVNPHTTTEPGAKAGNDVTTDRSSGLEEGSLALLGIDPSTISTDADHPPPIPLPNKLENTKKDSNIISITGSDDSSQTVITVGSSNTGFPVGSEQSLGSQSSQTPTKDIVNAARQIAALGALDNSDFGLDGFSDDLGI